MPPGTVEASINSLAWSLMVNTLEPALKLYLPLLNIQYSPTKNQLETLDSVWEQSRPVASVNSMYTSAPDHDFRSSVEDSAVARLSSRLDGIEAALKQLTMNNNTDKTQQNNENYQSDINYTNYNNMNNNNNNLQNMNQAPRFPPNYPSNYGPSYQQFPQQGAPRFASNYPSNYGPSYQQFPQQGVTRFPSKPQQYQSFPQGGSPKFGSNSYPAQSSNFKNGWCVYHRNFGSQARNCAKPCSFVNPNLN
jgi:hypothetical protein